MLCGLRATAVLRLLHKMKNIFMFTICSKEAQHTFKQKGLGESHERQQRGCTLLQMTNFRVSLKESVNHKGNCDSLFLVAAVVHCM